MLGPILPLLARQWGMLDSQSGLLMMAKFCGAFLGGVTVSRRLRRSLLIGLTAGAVGFGGFAMAPSMVVGCVCLFAGGYGLGQIITSVNILAGRRFTAHRGSALALLNFSFSLGAMLSALLAAWLLPRFALRGVLVGFAGLFVLGLAGLAVEMSRNDVAGRSLRPGPGGRSGEGFAWWCVRLFCVAAGVVWWARDMFERVADDLCSSLWRQDSGGERVHDTAALDVADSGAGGGLGGDVASG